MKRIQDKIKDLVEPQVFEQVGNYSDDPARALAAYRFTDVTADLLARWLDVLADLSRAGGAALALAGARGVGKSHTLSVFAALAGSERLRQTVADAHVATSARRLAGRRYAVVRVERGTRPTLAGEMAAAFARVFGGSEAQWSGGAAEMLSVAASRAFDETLVVIVDTSWCRPARVARDDGPVLGELAVTARSVNAFVGLALDDDIAGADGANVALAGTYQIDYLDPENLYRVAEQFVLRKRPQGRGTIHDIYQSLRTGIPGFNWSEARFASLYPVHPLVAEVAAGVRLYVPDFAFLPFAAGVAARASGRPALSLVLLDEVFDGTESDLRKSPDLAEAFAAYDQLTAQCIGGLPVMRRHQARLILKSLFVLSLDGHGATARELCAALLLPEELSAESASRQVEEMLARFASASNAGSLRETAEAGGQLRYRFQIGALEPAFVVGEPEAERTDLSSEPPARPQAAHEEARPAAAPTVAEPFPFAAPPPAAPKVDAYAEQSFKGLFDDEEEESEAAQASTQAVEEAIEIPAPTQAPAAEVARVDESNADPRAGELTEWARLLTGEVSLAPLAGPGGQEAVRAALGRWLDSWRALDLPQKFEELPEHFATTRVWKVEADLRKSFGRAAVAAESALAGKLTLEEALDRVGCVFRRSPEAFEARARDLEDMLALVEGVNRRERLRAYLAAAEATGVAEIETARRELLSLAADASGLLERERRERFERLWREFHARYAEHYAAVHDKTVGAAEALEAVRRLKRDSRWREFESLSRLPVVSARVWRQAAELLRRAETSRCELPVRQMLERQPACACRFRLAQAGELARLPQELEVLVERGLDVYRRTLLMLKDYLAIALDALARRESEEGTARRARTLSLTFAQGRTPERFASRDVRLIERAFERMAAPPPVRVAAPNGGAGLLTRDELRARFVQWLDELPEQPVLIELVQKSELNAP